MPFIRIMIHAVWGTKNHAHFLTDPVRQKVIEHIRENAITKNIYIDCIDGHTDHLHCLFSLNADITLAKALQLLKGEASHWINKNRLTPSTFEWADEYFAASVSESTVPKVRGYIRNQVEHHRTKSFSEEYEDFIKKYNMRING